MYLEHTLGALNMKEEEPPHDELICLKHIKDGIIETNKGNKVCSLLVLSHIYSDYSNYHSTKCNSQGVRRNTANRSGSKVFVLGDFELILLV